MRKHELDFPELVLIAGTRAMAGAGLGLLLAPRLKDSPRKAIGWTLLAIGALSTIPLLAHVFHDDDSADDESPSLHDQRREKALSP